jgi:hypothetical protein
MTVMMDKLPLTLNTPVMLLHAILKFPPLGLNMNIILMLTQWLFKLLLILKIYLPLLKLN